MTTRRLLLLVALLLPFGTSAGLAHAELAASQPARESTVTEPPGEILLDFTEAVELDFSLFAVHALDAAGGDMGVHDAWQRVNGLAGALVTEVIESRDDAPTRVDLGLANDDRRSEAVAIRLRDDLAPGIDVVMWRALSVDTHSTQGFFVF